MYTLGSCLMRWGFESGWLRALLVIGYTERGVLPRGGFATMKRWINEVKAMMTMNIHHHHHHHHHHRHQWLIIVSVLFCCAPSLEGHSLTLSVCRLHPLNAHFHEIMAAKPTNFSANSFSESFPRIFGLVSPGFQSDGVRVRSRVRFQAVKVPIFGGFPVENPT